MSVIVDSAQAESVLISAITDVTQNGWIPSSHQSDLIHQVILGSHLTYRYILITGILSKATNPNCNPLALQAGSKLSGAYDARSICHSVLVPIERKLLGGRLGESNEPFLNKPARYPELSTDNAVRRGNDTRLLHASIEVLSCLDSEEHAYQCLKDCIYYVFQRQSRNLADYLTSTTDGYQQSSLIEFANIFMKSSHEGETCALIVGATYSILGIAQSRMLDVKVHKVNQAGSSSKEISDVDVYENGLLVHTIEVKDKVFTSEDVQHAVRKAVMSGANSLVFAVGSRGVLQGSTCIELTSYWRQQGFNLYFTNVMQHFVSVLSMASEIDQRTFMDIMNYHAKQSNVKDETFNHIVNCARCLGW